MPEPIDLESTYAAARQALTAKEFDRARELLKQLVAEDETYKDASKLLAGLVARERRHWYNDARLWGAAAVVVLVVIGIAVASALPAVLPRATETPTVIALAPIATGTTTLPLPTNTSTVTPSPTPTVTPSVTPTRAPTAVPLAWKRVSLGQEFPRDDIMAIAVDPRDPEVIYAGGANAGVFKSVDGGESWQPSSLGLDRATVNTLAIDPKNTRILYAGVISNGVYKTTDGGEHWREINQGIPRQSNEKLSAVLVDPQDTNHLYYASTTGSIYETRSGGESGWNQVKSSACPANSYLALVMHPTNSQILFSINNGTTACSSGVYKSIDGGRTWSLTQIQGGDFLNRPMAIDQKDGLGLYVQQKVSNTSRIFFRSSDGGATWDRLARPPGQTCTVIAVQPDNPDHLYCGISVGEFRESTDGGNNWRPLYNVSTSVYQSLAFIRQPKTILLGGQGVHVSTDDGDSWNPRNNGLGIAPMDLKLDHVSSGVIYASERTDFVTSNSKLYRSLDMGGSWERVSTVGIGLALDADGKTLYRFNSDNTNAIGISQNRGASWTNVTGTSPSYVPMVAANPHQSGMVLMSGYDSPAYFLRYSTDYGATWQNASGFNPRAAEVTVAFDHDRGQVVYAIANVDPQQRSSDGGKTWSSCGPTGASFPRAADTRSVVDPRNNDRILIATRGNGVFISNDGCRSWQVSDSGLGNGFVNALAIDPKNPDRVYAGTDGGAYVSLDGAKSWNQINDGLLGALVVYSIAVDPRDSTVYASTPYGVLRLESQ